MKRSISWILIFTFFLMASNFNIAFAQDSIQAKLNEGIQAYDNFEYGQAIDNLTEATRSGKLNRNDQLRGLEYLSACYIIKKQQTQATEIIKRIIDIDPSYKMDETKFPGSVVADYTTYFQQIKGQFLVANVTITSDPVGATLLLDSYQRNGVTPITLPFVTSGEHTFTLQKPEWDCVPLTKIQSITNDMANTEISFELACRNVPASPTEPKTTIPPVKEKKGSSKKWLFIGGGALLVGGIAAVALSGGGDGGSSELAMPPNFPQ